MTRVLRNISKLSSWLPITESNKFNFYPQPVPEDSFVRIVSKAMELWDKHGATVISDAPTVH